ncbi:hypothetical protein BDV93DRAFT_563887 [Ceratobasidium sp. AG-I]|nr:hypothetical protein BDV93DRAFT_563887 [Ceratobasidium sp. AG-I]
MTLPAMYGHNTPTRTRPTQHLPQPLCYRFGCHVYHCLVTFTLAVTLPHSSSKPQPPAHVQFRVRDRFGATAPTLAVLSSRPPLQARLNASAPVSLCSTIVQKREPERVASKSAGTPRAGAGNPQNFRVTCLSVQHSSDAASFCMTCHMPDAVQV